MQQTLSEAIASKLIDKFCADVYQLLDLENRRIVFDAYRQFVKQEIMTLIHYRMDMKMALKEAGMEFNENDELPF